MSQDLDDRLRRSFTLAADDAAAPVAWGSFEPTAGAARAPRRRRPVRVFVVAAVLTCVVTGLAAAATGTSPVDWIIRPAPPEDPGFPDASTLDAISVFEDDDAPRMTPEDYEIIEGLLPEGTGKVRQGLLTRETLPAEGRDASRVLFDEGGRRISGVRLVNGELCYVAKVSTTSDSLTAGCTFGLRKSGVHTGGEWTIDQGQIMYGILRDDVDEVRIRTNTGELRDVEMGRNSFIWYSESRDRSVRAAAVLVQQPDGAFEEVVLPDEGNVGTPDEGGFEP
jgi:hypothetical protein